MKKLERNMADPKWRDYWEKTERTAEMVRQWPAWKRGLPTDSAPQKTEVQDVLSPAKE